MRWPGVHRVGRHLQSCSVDASVRRARCRWLRTAGTVLWVMSAIWRYTVGGKQVVRAWFSYRLREPSRRKRSSDLDKITARRWQPEFDDQMLELLNVVGRCVMMEPRQANLLAEICDKPMVDVVRLEEAGVFPVANRDRKVPRQRSSVDMLQSM